LRKISREHDVISLNKFKLTMCQFALPAGNRKLMHEMTIPLFMVVLWLGIAKGMVINMNTKNRCYIVGAGEFHENELPQQSDYVIAADGGYSVLAKLNIVPDMLIGDFDSLKKVPNHPNIITCPVEKDDTDMMLAVRQGLDLGYKTFIINGGLGGRLDHTLANIQILKYLAEKTARGTLIGNNERITVINNDEITIDSNIAKGHTLSIFSMGDTAEGVTLKGLKYSLENKTLTNDYPIGCSNEFIGQPATISVRNGTLIIITQQKGSKAYARN